MSQNLGKYFDEGMRNWIIQTARKNHWRVARWIDLDDLIQDGLTAYAKCLNEYPELANRWRPTRNDRKHFMSLVQATFLNRITDLANSRTQAPVEDLVGDLAGDQEEERIWERISPRAEADALLNLLLDESKMPNEIKMLFELLSSDLLQGIGYKRNPRTGARETTNEYYCRLLGLDPGRINLQAICQTYFSFR